jgi:chemotaxis protein CheD
MNQAVLGGSGPWGVPANGRRIVVGIGELAVSNQTDQVIVTYALGSCIAVCLFDPTVRVAAMLHFLLPEASINQRRALEQPAAFGDTGIPLLLEAAARYGLRKKRAIVRLVGGAEVANVVGTSLATGHRNVLAARTVLWRHGLFIDSQDVGGASARTVHLAVKDGRLLIFNGREQIKEM